MPLVSSGVEHGNLRELALARMRDLGTQCRDVRTREVGIQEIHHKVKPYEVGIELQKNNEKYFLRVGGSEKISGNFVPTIRKSSCVNANASGIPPAPHVSPGGGGHPYPVLGVPLSCLGVPLSCTGGIPILSGGYLSTDRASPPPPRQDQ